MIQQEQLTDLASQIEWVRSYVQRPDEDAVSHSVLTMALTRIAKSLRAFTTRRDFQLYGARFEGMAALCPNQSLQENRHVVLGVTKDVRNVITHLLAQLEYPTP